jgi:hypothetical protein
MLADTAMIFRAPQGNDVSLYVQTYRFPWSLIGHRHSVHADCYMNIFWITTIVRLPKASHSSKATMHARVVDDFRH